VEFQCNGGCSSTEGKCVKIDCTWGVIRSHTSIAEFGVTDLVESDNEYISVLRSVQLS